MLGYYVPMFIRALLLFAMMAPSAFAQNGTDRGGGDPVAAEVFSIARGVAKKITAWGPDGTKEISAEQIKKVQDLVNCAYAEKETTCLLVVSSERVYRFPEKLPSVDAIEVTLINVANHKPPMIEVGRIRWKELDGDPLTKEMMVLHELFGAAGILANGTRIDDQFYLSYELKNKTLESWAKYKEHFTNTLLKLYDLNKGTLHLDVSHLATFGATIELTDTYKKIIHPEYFEKKKKKQEDLQRDSYNQLVDMVQQSCRNTFSNTSFIGKNMQAAADYYKDEGNKVIQAYSAEIKNSDPAWSNWSIGILNEYIAEYMKIVGLFQLDTANGEVVHAYLLENCPNPYTGALDQLAVCEIAAMKTGIQTHANINSEIHEKELTLVLEKMMEKINTTAGPADAH